MPRPAARPGASPAGTAPGDEAAAARAVREMFGRVAPRYDLLNRLLSARIDRYWRRCLVDAVRPWLERPGLRAADLCCGTADVLLALEQERRRILPNAPPRIIGSDFCRPMLTAAAAKIERRNLPSALVEADAAAFPLPDGALDLITVAYGLRNLANYRRGIEEFARLLDAGGCLAVLEFSQPVNRLWGPLFDLYFRRVLPKIGNAVSAADGAYSYLQHSVERFLTPGQLSDLMRASGFNRVEHRLLTGGISALHLACK